MELLGRREILTTADRITKDNVVKILTRCLAWHAQNAMEIDYLYRYCRGQQPILDRTKTVRTDILNKVVENHAAEIVQFTSGYFLGEPVTYVRRGDVSKTSEEIATLNDYMFYEDKASHDKDMSTWMAICGVGYRMVLPDRALGQAQDTAPFEIDTPDPRYTFVVYHSGFGHRRMMGVRQVLRDRGTEDNPVLVNCGYTEDHYFEVAEGVLTKWEPHALGDIPIFEYRLNLYRMGSFEPAIPLLDAINNITSNRVDGVEQFVQSFLKFKNCEIDEDTVKNLNKLGAIMIRSADGQEGDVEIMSQELNQTQTQTLVDYLYDQVLAICGVPATAKNGGSASADTGMAIMLRNGWEQTEARARDTELLFKKSEKQFLRYVLRLMRATRRISLDLNEVECKFTRRQHDNLLTKTQALLHMLEAGLNPEAAIATCGLFNDPMDVAAQSRQFLKKWDYVDPMEQAEQEAELQMKVAEKQAKAQPDEREQSVSTQDPDHSTQNDENDDKKATAKKDDKA